MSLEYEDGSDKAETPSTFQNTTHHLYVNYYGCNLLVKQSIKRRLKTQNWNVDQLRKILEMFQISTQVLFFE